MKYHLWGEHAFANGVQTTCAHLRCGLHCAKHEDVFQAGPAAPASAAVPLSDANMMPDASDPASDELTRQLEGELELALTATGPLMSSRTRSYCSNAGCGR